MSRENAALSYIEQSIAGSDGLTRVAIIYEIAQIHMTRARKALVSGDCRTKTLAVDRVARCLGLLQSTLDMERGGQIAANLDRLYGYLQRRLHEAHAQNNPEIFGEIAGHLATLSAAWNQAANRGAAPALAAAATATR